MAQLRFTRKAIILIIVAFVLIGGGVGYGLWYLNNQQSQVAPEDSEAGGGTTGNGNCCLTDNDCISGYKCIPSDSCDPGTREEPKQDDDDRTTDEVIKDYDSDNCTTAKGCNCSTLAKRNACLNGEDVNKGGNKGDSCTKNNDCSEDLICRNGSCQRDNSSSLLKVYAAELVKTKTGGNTSSPWIGKCVKDTGTSHQQGCYWGSEVGNTSVAPKANSCYCSDGTTWSESADRNCYDAVPDDADQSACTSPSDCYGLTCEYPKATYCDIPTGSSSGQCKCVDWNKQSGGKGVSCNAAPASCEPADCPTGEVSCGTSDNRTDSSSDCYKYNQASCTTQCPGCNNPSKIYRYCKPSGSTKVPSNLCEGGDLLSEETVIGTGEPYTISGYAFDEDGIDTSAVLVRLDGSPVGSAGTEEACPSNNTIVCNDVGEDKNPIIWEYTFDSLSSGSHTISVSWVDVEGRSGSLCQTSATVTSTTIENPDWLMSKTSSGVCENENTESPSALVTYVITVKNIGSVLGEIATVEDVLDEKVDESFIVESSIDPTATVSGNIITWDLTGNDAEFDPGEEKVFTYQLSIPSESFGVYENVVTATPVGDEEGSFTAENSLLVDCDAFEGIPETGIFDNTIGRMSAALVLIMLGATYLYFDGIQDGIVNIMGYFGYEKRVERSRKNFQKKLDD